MKREFITKTLTIFAFLLVFTFGFFAPKAYAQMGSMMGLDNDETQVNTDGSHAESVKVVLQDILDKQNVSTVQKLDLSKISDEDWEKFGDAVMESYHQGEAHETMDRMMGYNAFGGYGILCAVTWILAIVFLVSGSYFFLRGAYRK